MSFLHTCLKQGQSRKNPIFLWLFLAFLFLLSQPVLFRNSIDCTAFAREPATAPSFRLPAKNSQKNPQEVASASLRTFRFFSPNLGAEAIYHAFVPPGKWSAERFPVVYLLHGAGGSQQDWLHQGQNVLPKLAAELRLIVVLPSAGPYSWYADAVSGPLAERFFIDELLPHAESHLPANGQRSIAGLSMGGHGALVLGLRHPGLFRSLSSMSGVLDLTLHPKQWRLESVFGPLSSRRAAWEAHSACHLLNTVPPATIPPLLITTGSEDRYVQADNRRMAEALKRLSLPHTYRETPGVHDWNYWIGQVPEHLAFHAGHLYR